MQKIVELASVFELIIFCMTLPFEEFCGSLLYRFASVNWGCRCSCMHISLKVPPQHLSKDEVWISTGSLTRLLLFFLSHSHYLMVHLRLLSCCMNELQPSFNCQTDCLIFYPRILLCTGKSMTARCPDRVAAKQAQIITPPPPCLTAGMRCLCWYTGFGLWSNISSLVTSLQMTLFQKSCGLFQIRFWHHVVILQTSKLSKPLIF